MSPSLPRSVVCLLPLLLLVLLDGREALAAACTYSLSSTSWSFGTLGGRGSFTVQTQDGCPWSASTSASWIDIGSDTGPGTGAGVVTFTVGFYYSGGDRIGTITVADQTFTVTQWGLPCTYSLSSEWFTFTSVGGSRSFSVRGITGCTWSASTSSSWISITSGSGSGDGTVSFDVSSNPGDSRSGTITVGDQTFIVLQEGATSCYYLLSSNFQDFDEGGGGGSFWVSTTSGCSWSASTPSSWISITSGAGPGSGTVSYDVSANPSTSPRAGRIIVGHVMFEVHQKRAPCTFTISPTSVSIGPDNYWEGRFSVQAPRDCLWCAGTTARWIYIILESRCGWGNGGVQFHVSANPGASPRTGIMGVSGGDPPRGAMFTVHQEGTGVPLRPPAADFDGDGTADWVLYRHGAWLYFGPCGHLLNERGPALDPACSSCVSKICTSFTPYCCDQYWDSFCVDAVKFMCQ